VTNFAAPSEQRESPAPLPEEQNFYPSPDVFQEIDEIPLGFRVAAALIDLVLLCGLLLILGLTVGGISVERWKLSVSLDVVWWLLYVALGLVYYFAFEATTGQTVGKRLLGLRVFSAEGGRPSASAIAGRTLLRLVDAFPVMYVVGMITMLVTGGQRVGDLAAKTVVARAVPARRRSLALVPLAVVVLAVVGLSVYRASPAGSTKTYRGHGVAFDYPAAWHETQVEAGALEGGAGKLWTAAVSRGGRYDLVSVAAFRLNSSVTPEEVKAAKADLTQLVRGMYEQLGGAIQAGPEEIIIGGKPGLRFRGTATLNGVSVEETDIFVFDGNTEYQLECTHTRDNAAEVGRACDKIQRSFTVA